MSDSGEALLRLALTPGIGPRAVLRLLFEFRGPVGAWEATASAWEAEAELPARLHRLSHGREVDARAKSVQRRCRELDIAIVPLGSVAYPAALSSIFDPPPILYRRGDMPSSKLLPKCAAIVGTRKASTHGLSFTYRLAAELSRAGAPVVSGLAMGIDAEAHRAVVDTGGIGIAVLPGGLEAIHPPANRSLGENLCERGCLLSEHPPGTSLKRGYFVGRNRIISGLSKAVAIIEAGENSGALLTAEFAIEQDRSLFVMPGRPGDPRVTGSLPLLRDGAGLLLSSADIAQELGLETPTGLREALEELGDDGTLFALGGASFDAILDASGLSPPQLLAQLSRLEMTGRIRRGPDGHYYRQDR